jgi:hypothetical protein
MLNLPGNVADIKLAMMSCIVMCTQVEGEQTSDVAGRQPVERAVTGVEADLAHLTHPGLSGEQRVEGHLGRTSSEFPSTQHTSQALLSDVHFASNVGRHQAVGQVQE